MNIRTKYGIFRKTVKCGLLCVTCDIPAGQKACGVLGHTTALGCCKCLKRFTGKVGSMKCSGFDGQIVSIEKVLQQSRKQTTKRINKERRSDWAHMSNHPTDSQLSGLQSKVTKDYQG